MSGLEEAIQRVNKLKSMAETLISANGQNNKLIENKIAVIQNRIVKLSELKESLKTRFNLLSSQTADIQRLVSQTQGLEELEGKLQALQAQISGVNNLDLSDLDKTINELEQLIKPPGAGNGTSGNAGAAASSMAQGQQLAVVPRAVSPLRERPSALSPPGAPRSDSEQQGGFRYDSVAKSKSKSRNTRKRKSTPLKSKSKSRRNTVSKRKSVQRRK